MLGKKVRDKLTGVVGIVTGRCEYLEDATLCMVKRTDETGDIMGWMEETRLEVIEESADQEASAEENVCAELKNIVIGAWEIVNPKDVITLIEAGKDVFYVDMNNKKVYSAKDVYLKALMRDLKSENCIFITKAKEVK